MAADTSSSTSAFVTTLIFNGVVAVIFLLLFWYLKPKNKRVYEPRTLTDIQTISEEERIDTLEYDDENSWLGFLLSRPHSFLIQHCSIDGYLFLRYIGIFAGLSFISCFILFPILLPVNITNGNHLEGFEVMSFANVRNKNRFYAHVFLSWIIFGLFTYVIYRELYFYISLRHSLQTTPLYDGLLSSRTVVVTELSDTYNQEGEFDRLFPNAAHIIFARNLKELQNMVKERDETAQNYEKTLNKLINKCVKKQNSEKKREKLYKDGKPKDDLSTYVPHNKRPKKWIKHWPLPTFLGGEKVDLLTYSTKQIGDLNDKIKEKQQDWQKSNHLNSVFLIFDTQLEAQRCFQSVPDILGFTNYGKCLIGCTPDDLNWDNLNLTKKARYMKRLTANSILTAMIIFWAIPVAVVGCISNVNFLVEKIHFLHFLNNVPNVIMGIITGLVPSLALSILMSLVAPFIKKIGEMSGDITRQETDQYCQKWYFAFQVLNTFIVTTLASSASSTVTAIIDEPGSAMTLLANNLPKASNFFITYFLLQGLSMPTGQLLQVANLILSKFMGRILDTTPRQKWNRYNTLSKPSMGVVYPTVEILVCIMISYIIIAPILLVFSTMTFLFLYFAYLYNLNFVMGFSFDLKGRNYPRALFQVFVGIYLSEVCLLGLFIMAKAWGPLVLECFWIVVTALAHIYMKWRFLPLIDAIPLSAILNARGSKKHRYPQKDQGLKEVKGIGEDMKKLFEDDNHNGVLRPATKGDLRRADLLPEDELESDSEGCGDDISTLGDMEESLPKNDRKQSNVTDGSKYASTFVGSDEDFKKLHYADVKDMKKQQQSGPEVNPEGAVVGNADVGKIFSDPMAMTDDPNAFPDNILPSQGKFKRLANFFEPSKSYPFCKVRNRLPHSLNTTIQYNLDYAETAYTDPSVNSTSPIVWICRDPMGVSQRQIDEAHMDNVPITDEFTEYDEKGRAQFTFNPPDFIRKAKK
ncbi:Phosphate metabolism protein 7 [Nakaseomyces glabratus]|uniref:Phosphate metabolism protein 7 n=1 Tax=Candida glabrata TaxID=5478 RepID=A0A0W0D063_CANGB|nr:Phosphate metabolism protein 7 [Nakaseomyces glabratus]KTB01922.1 Phosphate metabolism protein 7 [Nakaseomyces glabratus]KTB05204.1 Phosphate metabolism protein 7 [Nakaseomyces glabratus]KTB17724.1 Phosphate metabolism protein 7 [Nakaseomyces glabratus]